MVEFVDQADDLDIVLGSVGGGYLLFSLCLSAQSLRPRIAILPVSPPAPWMLWTPVKRDRFVLMPNPNIHPDGLRTSLGELTPPILRRHVARFFALKRRENPPCHAIRP